MNDRTKGLGIALFGVFCVSPDALLVRFLSTHGSDPWTIIFWKLLLSIPLSATFAIYEAGGVKKLINIISSGRGFYCAVVPVQSVIDIGYTLSFVYTSAAVALLLINLNPLWGAIIGKIVLKDALPLRTYIAMILALGCMLIIFIPELISGEERSTTSLTGNVISLFTGFLMALYLSIVRKAGQYDISLVGGTPLGAFSSTIISAIITRGQVLPSLFWDTDMWKFWLSVVAQGISIGIVFVAMVRVSLG
jgi:drug/metabolite transporter (DMT)-like permease